MYIYIYVYIYIPAISTFRQYCPQAVASIDFLTLKRILRISFKGTVMQILKSSHWFMFILNQFAENFALFILEILELMAR